MFRNLVIFFCFFASTLSAWEFVDKTGEVIQLEICQMQDLHDCEEIFVAAFSKAYEDFSAEELCVVDKIQFLHAAFADVYEDMQLGLQTLMVAKCDGVILGFVGFKRTETPHQIYISQLAVDPDHWRKGLGSHLVFSSLQIFDDVESLVVIPRRINLIARKFYFSLGFTESTYMHPGYNPQRYIGYEWRLHETD